MDGRYSMMLPGFLEETDDLALDASLQYKNPYRNFYVIVIEEDKNSAGMDLDAYHEMVIQRITTDTFLKEPTIENIDAKVVNGKNAIIASIFGKMDKEKIFYKHMTVEGESQYYQVVVWLRGEKRRNEYQETVDSVLNSFREL